MQGVFGGEGVKKRKRKAPRSSSQDQNRNRLANAKSGGVRGSGSLSAPLTSLSFLCVFLQRRQVVEGPRLWRAEEGNVHSNILSGAYSLPPSRSLSVSLGGGGHICWIWLDLVQEGYLMPPLPPPPPPPCSRRSLHIPHGKDMLQITAGQEKNIRPPGSFKSGAFAGDTPGVVVDANGVTLKKPGLQDLMRMLIPPLSGRLALSGISLQMRNAASQCGESHSFSRRETNLLHAIGVRRKQKFCEFARIGLAEFP